LYGEDNENTVVIAPGVTPLLRIVSAFRFKVHYLYFIDGCFYFIQMMK